MSTIPTTGQVASISTVAVPQARRRYSLLSSTIDRPDPWLLSSMWPVLESDNPASGPTAIAPELRSPPSRHGIHSLVDMLRGVGRVVRRSIAVVAIILILLMVHVFCVRLAFSGGTPVWPGSSMDGHTPVEGDIELRTQHILDDLARREP